MPLGTMVIPAFGDTVVLPVGTSGLIVEMGIEVGV